VAVAAALLVALVRFVHANPGTGPGTASSPAAAERANRLGRILTAQDQAPGRAPLPRSLTPVIALERAIATDMRSRVRHGDLSGPVQRVSCGRVKRSPKDRPGFRCQARAGGFAYPFVGVIELSARAIVWCKDDQVSVDPGLQAPLSPQCRTGYRSVQ
jgi:hypothetical protein